MPAANNDSRILSTAHKTLDIEIEALQNLRNSIDGDFTAVVKLIHSSSGRVVVTGIGKSAIVAQKIVATLNSTGTPAVFMHAADARDCLQTPDAHSPHWAVPP